MRIQLVRGNHGHKLWNCFLKLQKGALWEGYFGLKLSYYYWQGRTETSCTRLPVSADKIYKQHSIQLFSTGQIFPIRQCITCPTNITHLVHNAGMYWPMFVVNLAGKDLTGSVIGSLLLSREQVN